MANVNKIEDFYLAYNFLLGRYINDYIKIQLC